MLLLYLQQPSRVFRVCKLAGVADIVSRAFERVYKPSNSLLVSVDTNQVQPMVNITIHNQYLYTFTYFICNRSILLLCQG